MLVPAYLVIRRSNSAHDALQGVRKMLLPIGTVVKTVSTDIQNKKTLIMCLVDLSSSGTRSIPLTSTPIEKMLCEDLDQNLSSFALGNPTTWTRRLGRGGRDRTGKEQIEDRITHRDPSEDGWFVYNLFLSGSFINDDFMSIQITGLHIAFENTRLFLIITDLRTVTWTSICDRLSYCLTTLFRYWWLLTQHRIVTFEEGEKRRAKPVVFDFGQNVMFQIKDKAKKVSRGYTEILLPRRLPTTPTTPRNLVTLLSTAIIRYS